ncbi:GAF and ANTAR domain-containing protein [Mycobacterium sp.]|uniref:GAF and ANTAR domain-containing protein n=1 Tax=Mycobacterium sp. TaxID=1785 RepID=UPI003D0EFC80
MEYEAQPDRDVWTRAGLTRAESISAEEDLADGLRKLTALVAGAPSFDDLLAEIAGFAAHAIPGVDGAGVTLIEPRSTTMGIAASAVTAPFVREIDILQYETLQEGPSITGMKDGVAVISCSLGGDRRWPRFGAGAARLGVASSMSLPLLIADQVVGSVNCYAHWRDAFGEHAVRLGTQFAQPAAFSVYNAQLIAAARDTAERLQHALVIREVIAQAIGIIRGRTGATAEDAFNRLRRISQTENTTLHEVARRVVEDADRRVAQ